MKNSIDSTISTYEVKVFSLAMTLTGDEEDAKKIVEDVFVRIAQEGVDCAIETLETLIHRFTYEASLERMVAPAEPTEVVVVDEALDAEYVQ